MTAATRYAKALFELASAHKQLAALSAPVATLAEAVAEPSITRALHNPKLSDSQRATFAKTLASSVKAPALLANTLGLLAQNNRLALLPETLNAFIALAEAEAGITHITVQSAQPLSAEQREQLKKFVMKEAKSNGVQFTETEMPELIAGFRAFFNGKVWDTSLSGGLARLKASLTQRLQLSR